MKANKKLVHAKEIEGIIPFHTKEIQEIIEIVPSWIIRWGITIIFVIFILIGLLVLLMKFPDLYQGNLSMSVESLATPLLQKRIQNLAIFS